MPTLLRLLSSPNVGSRRPVYQRYDHTILTNTVVAPGEADAAVLRLKGTSRAVVIAIDCNSRYCYLDPELGARHAVAEATRNVACVGARPLAITNCLNFGNPEKPAGYHQLERCVAGLAAACAALGVPVVSGNVSLYNETADRAVMPTPTVGAVGVIDDVTRRATMRWQAGDVILLTGGARPSLGGSEYLARQHDLTAGRPPCLDLEEEVKAQRVVRELVAAGVIQAAHDCADGGLLVALAEMAIVSGVGCAISGAPPPGATGRVDEAWFGEAPSRIVVAAAKERDSDVIGLCQGAGLSVTRLGSVGGDTIAIVGVGAVPISEATASFDHALDYSS